MTTAVAARTRVTYKQDSDEEAFRSVPENEEEQLEPVVFVEERRLKAATTKQVSIRVRSGNGAYSEWMNEIKVHLLPNFRHRNVVPAYHLQDITASPDRAAKLLDELVRRVANTDSDRTSAWVYEYAIMNKFHNGSQTMRNYIKENTLTWPELLRLTIGIMKGLEYLHENHSHTIGSAYRVSAVDGFIQGTKGLIRPLKRSSKVYSCDPVYSLAVIHRDLTSHNILFTDKLTPRITNFGSAIVFYPMQPSNCVQMISGRAKNRFTSSVYSSPEVLEGYGELNLAAMKAIDMYSSGIILWELMSRTILPKISPQTSLQLLQQRTKPQKYKKPYEDLLGREYESARLRIFVSVYHIRPSVESWWTLGRKTNKFCNIFQELWDNDAEARPRPANVLERVQRLGISDRDKLNHGRYRMNIKKPCLIGER